MARTTKKQIETKFERFVKAIGGHIAKDYKDVGGYELDYDSVNGGYLIGQISSNSGALSCPFGHVRRKASDFWDTLDFGERVADSFKAK